MRWHQASMVKIAASSIVSAAIIRRCAATLRSASPP
jgi:hypothetical protein